jgi:hypothetical protein
LLSAAIFAQSKRAARQGTWPELMRSMDRQGHGKVIRAEVEKHLKRTGKN